VNLPMKIIRKFRNYLDTLQGNNRNSIVSNNATFFVGSNDTLKLVEICDSLLSQAVKFGELQELITIQSYGYKYVNSYSHSTITKSTLIVATETLQSLCFRRIHLREHY